MLLWVPEERFVVSILGNTLLHLTVAAYCIVDVVLDPLFDLTFISHGAVGGTTRWLRNRIFVGKRVVQPRHPSGRRAPQ